jgi:hypothetical protein
MLTTSGHGCIKQAEAARMGQGAQYSTRLGFSDVLPALTVSCR